MYVLKIKKIVTFKIRNLSSVLAFKLMKAVNISHKDERFSSISGILLVQN